MHTGGGAIAIVDHHRDGRDDMLEYRGILHGSVIVADLGAALAFYVDVLGLTVNDQRPDLGYPGAWLDIGGQQIHLLALSNPDPVAGRPGHVGRDRHIAVAVTDIEPLRRRLAERSISYTLSRSGRRALFCRDPDGNGMEFIEQRR